MKNNTKGFTLIELLAVIVILAVIALIATPLIMGVIDEARKGAMNQNKKTMEKAAELFLMKSENQDRAPQLDGDRVYIQLEELENGYMKKIAGSCEGYVAVDKENSEYYYTAYLDCGDGNALYVDSEYVNYGGKYVDEFTDAIKTTNGGFVTVGYSNSPNFGKLSNHSSEVTKDALIVKYTKDGKVEWENNFGGSKNDEFTAVIEVEDGYLALGNSYSNDGDLSNLETDVANIVLAKYDKKGKLVKKVIVSKSATAIGNDLMLLNDKVYIVGLTRETPNGASLAFVACLNKNLEIEWKKFYGGNYVSSFSTLTISNNNNILVGGHSLSTDGDMADIKIGEKGVSNAILFEINPLNGDIVSKYAYDKINTISNKILVYDDFYIIGNEYNLLKVNSNNGEILKNVNIGKISSIEKNENNILIAKYNSKSFQLCNLDNELEIVNEKTFNTTQQTKLNKIIKDNEDYYSFGLSYSTTDFFEDFNYGNGDAILLKLDKNLNLKEDFKLQTLIKQKMPELVKNYGTKIPTPEERENLKIFTTNDSTRMIGDWCINYNDLDPNSNYNYPNCLFSFNDMNRINVASKMFHAEITQNSHFILDNISINNINNWIQIHISYGNSGNDYSISNLKIKFTDTEEVTITKAVELGYIEPLVISGFKASGKYYFSNSYNVLNGGDSGLGNYPYLYIYLKPKNKKLVSVSFNSNKIPANSNTACAIGVNELNNFDMSLSPAIDK